MQPTQTTFGIWSGGRFMHFGEDIGEERMLKLIARAHEKNVRTFMTADVYGEGKADELLGRGLKEFRRDSYCLIGAVGHDFYGTERVYEAFPRFTDPGLRGEKDYASYLKMAAEKELERLGLDRFDVLMLHNPDHIGFSSEAVWKALDGLRREGITESIGVAPGPANGFTLDIIHCFEKFGELIDWAMIILNPLETWPGGLCLPAAEKYGVKVLTRVVDYGGLFLGGLNDARQLKRGDHRAYRPDGWIEAAKPKIERYQRIADQYGMNLLQLACRWELAQPAVESVVPTLIQEADPSAPTIEDHLDALAEVPNKPEIPKNVADEMGELGSNKGCMALKGGSAQFVGKPTGDQWPLTAELLEVGKRWSIVPDRDLYYADDTRDIREKGAPKRGIPQTSNRRLFLQLQCFGECSNPGLLTEELDASGLEYVLYLDVNDPHGVAVLFIVEDPEDLATKVRDVLNKDVFLELTYKPEMTMVGRTYSAGREPDLEDWMLVKPRRNALSPEYKWAIWYPLRRKGSFNLLPKREQGKMLFEHAMIGRTYGKSGYASDIRLASHGLDKNDNEFVLGIVGEELYPLSRLVQDMRITQQTSEYMDSLGPFFVGRVFKQSPLKV